MSQSFHFRRRTPTDTYIGLDAHSSSCTLGVLGPSGKRLGLHVVETDAKAVIEVLRRFRDLDRDGRCSCEEIIDAAQSAIKHLTA